MSKEATLGSAVQNKLSYSTSDKPHLLSTVAQHRIDCYYFAMQSTLSQKNGLTLRILWQQKRHVQCIHWNMQLHNLRNEFCAKKCVLLNAIDRNACVQNTGRQGQSAANQFIEIDKSDITLIYTGIRVAYEINLKIDQLLESLVAFNHLLLIGTSQCKN